MPGDMKFMKAMKATKDRKARKKQEAAEEARKKNESEEEAWKRCVDNDPSEDEDPNGTALGSLHCGRLCPHCIAAAAPPHVREVFPR